MADDDTTGTAPAPAAPAAAGIDPAMLQRLITQLQAPVPPPMPSPDSGPSSRDGRGFLSLLGEALGGGQQYGSTAEREQGGLAAAQAMGLRMLAASDYSVRPHTLGSIIAQGQMGARESLGESQAVSAARMAAAQEQAHQAEGERLARLKELIPLLQLQQTSANTAAVAGIPSAFSGGGGGGGGAPGAPGSLANVGHVDVPPEYLPFYREASEKTGVPIEVLLAKDRQESGYNPGTTGGAGEVGISQILPRTAMSPGYGMQGVRNPAELRDPRTNILFGAQYLAARAKAAGVDWSTPDGIAKGLRAYNGGGDPNYAQNVMRFLPGARLAAAGGVAPPPAGSTAPPGTAPAAAPVRVAGPGAPLPPDQTPAILRPQVRPPPEPTPQPAGDGAPATAPGPAAPGTVPGPPQTALTGPPPVPGATPAPAPTPPPTPPPTTANPVPGQWPIEQPAPAFSYVPRPIPPGVLPTGQLPPAAQQIVEIARRSYENAIHLPGITPQQRQAAEATLQKTLGDQLTAQTGVARSLTDAIVKFGQDDFQQQKDTYAKQLEDYYKRQDFARTQGAEADKTATAQKNAIEIERIKTANSIEQQGALTSMKGDEKRMENIGTAATQAQGVSNSVRQLIPIIKNLPADGAVPSILGQYPQLLPFLKQSGIVSSDQADNLALFEGLTNHLSTQLRISGTGSMSDTDLATFKSTLPRLMASPQGRLQAAAFLQNLSDRLIEEQEFTQEYFRRTDPKTGKPAFNLSHLNEVIKQPRRIDQATGFNVGGLGPVVPHAPDFSGETDPYQAARKWLNDNVGVGHPYTVGNEIRIREQ